MSGRFAPTLQNSHVQRGVSSCFRSLYLSFRAESPRPFLASVLSLCNAFSQSLPLLLPSSTCLHSYSSASITPSMDQIYPIPAALLHSFPPILETLMETVRRIEQGQNETPPACCSCESTENTENLQRACPRSGCASYYCRDCLKTMFTLAVQEGLQFPAHCCGIIQIHTVLPDLDADVAKAYRAALEKYLSVKNVYCPVRTCSAFIPDRLIPIAHTSNSSGDRGPVDLPEKPTKEGGPVDLPDTFPCPACKASVCTRCYRVDHQPNACRDDGRREADEYESEMLTKFGYKQCPRCGEAVTRMFGCRHM